jgi:hypothetical protein
MTDSIWGPLAEPPHPDAAGPDDPPWRDNAFFSLVDPARRAGAVIHFSTSPNAQGTRARASVAAEGRTGELVEALDPGVMSSKSIKLDLESGVITVDSRDLALELQFAPRFVIADYTKLDGFFTPLREDKEPLQHFQQGVNVTGWIEIDGQRTEVNGQGFRDRSWGFRDDQRASAQPDDKKITIEYIALGVCMEKCDLTLMKMLQAGGDTTIGGFIITDTLRRVVNAEITRDAAGLLDSLDVEIEDGEKVSMRTTGQKVGFWLPLGVPRKGPVLSAYDEIVGVDGGSHGTGGGVFEHGTVRRLC